MPPPLPSPTAQSNTTATNRRRRQRDESAADDSTARPVEPPRMRRRPDVTQSAATAPAAAAEAAAVGALHSGRARRGRGDGEDLAMPQLRDLLPFLLPLMQSLVGDDVERGYSSVLQLLSFAHVMDQTADDAEGRGVFRIVLSRFPTAAAPPPVATTPPALIEALEHVTAADLLADAAGGGGGACCACSICQHAFAPAAAVADQAQAATPRGTALVSGGGDDADGAGSGPAVRLPGCRHVFHKACIEPWLARSQTCPNCRCNVVDTAAAMAAGTLPAST